MPCRSKQESQSDFLRATPKPARTRTLATDRRRIHSLRHTSDVKRGAMSNPDRKRPPRGILLHGRLDRFVECVAEEKLSRFRLDRHESIEMIAFQIQLQSVGVDAFGAIDDRLSFG